MCEELDAKVWRELPAEILERVLQWLPISTLCKFRTVCKYWNTLPTVRADEPFILKMPCDSVKGLRYCFLYSPTANRWDFIDLSFLFRCMPGPWLTPCHWVPRIERLCSDGGLMCVWVYLQERDLRHCFSDIIPHYALLMCNPLTKSSKLLPQFDFTYKRTIDLVMRCERSGEYKVFAVVIVYTGEPGINLRHYMYDSASGSWNLLLELKRDCSDVTLLRYCSIVFDGVYYCVSGGGRQRYDLYAYDIKQGTWVAAGVEAIQLNQKPTEVSFVVSNGCLLLIASSLEENPHLRITKVDLRAVADSAVDSSAAIVSAPTAFSWEQGIALAYRDTIILAAESKRRFMAVDLLSLSGDLKELKPVTPMPLPPQQNDTRTTTWQTSALICKQPSSTYPWKVLFLSHTNSTVCVAS